MSVVKVVKIHAITSAEGGELQLEARSGSRAHEVEHMEGFEGFELLRPLVGDDRCFVYTRWRSEEDFHRWVSSDEFRRGHATRAEIGPSPSMPRSNYSR